MALAFPSVAPIKCLPTKSPSYRMPINLFLCIIMQVLFSVLLVCLFQLIQMLQSCHGGAINSSLVPNKTVVFPYWDQMCFTHFTHPKSSQLVLEWELIKILSSIFFPMLDNMTQTLKTCGCDNELLPNVLHTLVKTMISW